MSERLNESVAVVFRKGSHILVPPEPFHIPHEPRIATEVYEKTAYRLAASYEVKNAKVDTILRLPEGVGMPTRGYLLTDTDGVLDQSDFYLHESAALDHIHAHRQLQPCDVALFTAAITAIRFR